MFEHFPFRVSNDWSAGFRAGLGIALLIALGLFILAVAIFR